MEIVGKKRSPLCVDKNGVHVGGLVGGVVWGGGGGIMLSFKWSVAVRS